MTRGRFFIIPWLRVIVALATLATLAAFLPAARAGAPELRPVQVSEHVWYVQGDSGMASAANQGFNSNAGFVVTRDSVIVIDALGTLGLDHTSPEAAAAGEAFRGLRGATRHLLTASGSGQELLERDARADVLAAAEVDAAASVPVLRDVTFATYD